MTGTDIERVGTYGRATLAEKQQYAAAIASAQDLLPKNYWTKAVNVNGQFIPPRPNPGAVLFMTETAQMLGIHPMAGLVNIHIIEGKPSLSAALWQALVREAGHRFRVWTEGEGDDLKAVATIHRSDDPDFEFRAEFTHKDAQKANLLGKDNWKNYEKSMLKARATTAVVRDGAAEVSMGAAYTPEELGAETDELGEPINLDQVTGDDVPRETRPETPIVDDVSQAGTASVQDYVDRAIAAETSDDILALYQEGRTTGLFTTLINPDETGEIELGAWIIEIGKALKAGEEEAAKAEAETVEAEIVDEGTPAVLADDAETVDADVVDEDWEAAEIAKHEAAEAAAAKPKGKR